jgi:hypothetical protein
MAVGSGTALQGAKETTWGTAVAATFPINFTSESIALKVDKKGEENLIASKSAMANDLLNQKVDGSFSFVLRPEFAGHVFKMALGGTDTVGTGVPVVSANTHTMVLADANASFPSYTFYVDRKVSCKKYSGCKVDSLELECKAGDFVKGTVNIKGKDEATGTLTGGLTLINKSFKTIGASLVLGAVTYDVNTATLKISNSLQEQPQTFGSGVYNPEPLHSTREVTIDFELPYCTDIETLKSSYLVSETLITSGVLTLVSPSYVTGTTNYKVTITLNNLSVTDVSYNVGSSGIISAKVSCKALAIGTTEPISVAVIDGQSTAY